MNRVVLCGRLAGRPKLSYTPSGIAVAEFQLLVRKERRPDPPEDLDEHIDCIAIREAAQELTTWGDRDYRINLEGRLRGETYWNLDGRRVTGRRVTGLRVHADRTYFVDPVAAGLGTNALAVPNAVLPTPVGNRIR